MPLDLPIHGTATTNTVADSEVAARIEAETRTPRDGRWVAVNMVGSVDGATAVDGVSGPLGGRADRAVFLALRGVADVILAGSGTVTAERYGRPHLTEEVRARRAGRGQDPLPRLAVVSNRGEIDLDLPCFDPSPTGMAPLLLVAAGRLAEDRRRQLEAVAEVVEAGDATVDPATALTQLARRCGPTIVCEGGPTLNGLLAADDLIDEWCLTVAPVVVSGTSMRAAVGPPAPPCRLRLDRAWLDDSELLLRYLRAGS